MPPLIKIIQKQKTKKQADVDKLRRSYSALVKERKETEAGLNRTKPLNELDEQRETLKRKIEEDRCIMNDENSSRELKQAAAVRFLENTDELARLEPQIQEREEALPL